MSILIESNRLECPNVNAESKKKTPTKSGVVGMHSNMPSSLPGSVSMGTLPGSLNSSVSRLPMDKHDSFGMTAKLPEAAGMIPSSVSVANSTNPSSHIFGLPSSDISTFPSNTNELPSLYSSLNSNGSGSISNTQFSSNKKPPIVASHSSLPQVRFLSQKIGTF